MRRLLRTEVPKPVVININPFQSHQYTAQQFTQTRWQAATPSALLSGIFFFFFFLIHHWKQTWDVKRRNDWLTMLSVSGQWLSERQGNSCYAYGDFLRDEGGEQEVWQGMMSRTWREGYGKWENKSERVNDSVRESENSGGWGVGGRRYGEWTSSGQTIEPHGHGSSRHAPTSLSSSTRTSNFRKCCCLQLLQHSSYHGTISFCEELKKITCQPETVGLLCTRSQAGCST